MMKKLVLLLVMFLVCAGSAFAQSVPRWFTLPVSVYLPSNSYSSSVRNAFSTWQSSSGRLVYFVFKTNPKLETMSNIDVRFMPTYNSGSPYKIQARYNSNRISLEDNGFFLRVGITIYTKDKDGKNLSNSEVYSIALRAVGEAVGVKPISSAKKKKSVMSTDYAYDAKSLSSDDIYALKKVYWPNYKLKSRD